MWVKHRVLVEQGMPPEREFVNIDAYDRLGIVQTPYPPYPARTLSVAARRDRRPKLNDNGSPVLKEGGLQEYTTEIAFVADVDVAVVGEQQARVYVDACMALIEEAFQEGRDYCDVSVVPYPPGILDQPAEG